MQAQGIGILKNSSIFFYNKENFDSDTFMYPICVGQYYCDEKYITSRISYDNFLLFYIKSGTAYIVVDNKKKKVSAGNFVLIDCYKPHIYGSDKNCEMLWLHFNGSLSRKYYDYIMKFQKSNIIIANNSDNALRYLERIYNKLQSNNEFPLSLISRYITDMLTEFMLFDNDEIHFSSNLEQARIYMLENMDQNISIEDVANQVNLSLYYFTRLFKKEYGNTPHEYLIKARMNMACFYLTTSDMTIAEIAEHCGFTSFSNFCVCFKKHLKISPRQYRQQHFN